MSEQTYKRGDLVAVLRYGTELAEHVGKVEKVLKGRAFKYAAAVPPTLHVEGRKWAVGLDRVRLAQPGDAEEAERYQLAQRFRTEVDWLTLSLETLRKVAEMLRGAR